MRQQATTLAESQHATTQAAYMSSKEIELRHYVELAQSAIAPYYDAPAGTPREEDNAQKQALDALQRLDFGADGYFFVYTMHGTSLMHPRQPDLVGRDLWLMRDPAGALTIQKLITRGIARRRLRALRVAASVDGQARAEARLRRAAAALGLDDRHRHLSGGCRDDARAHRRASAPRTSIAR